MKLPQFHLRDLFWLVLLSACLTAWAIDRWHHSYPYLEDRFQEIAVRHKQSVQRAWWLQAALESKGYRIVESAGALRLIEPDNDLDAVDEPLEATPEP
jgi:hypothetical protein